MGEPKKTRLGKWPLMAGDYQLGASSESPVVVVTLASNLQLDPSKFALAGGMRTENLGVERIVTNIVANPNVRFVVLCGEESRGHLSGQALMALWKNGIDEKNRIVGAKGAFPYVENVPREAIARFQKQVEIVDMIGVSGKADIEKGCDGLIARDPGSFGEPMVFIEVRAEEEGKGPCAEGSILVSKDVMYDYCANIIHVAKR